MADTPDRQPRRAIHPLHAFLLASAVPLFLGALLSDIAYYAQSYESQWSNFAAWLLVGGLVFTGSALLWAVVILVRSARRGGHALI